MDVADARLPLDIALGFLEIIEAPGVELIVVGFYVSEIY
jgi:hypothetical protein